MEISWYFKSFEMEGSADRHYTAYNRSNNTMTIHSITINYLKLSYLTIAMHHHTLACTRASMHARTHLSIDPSMHACMHKYLEFRIMMHPI